MYLNKIKTAKNINKIEYINERIKLLNKTDILLNCQRIYARIMYKNKWIDERKFNIVIDKIYEIGKILGG